MELLQLKYFCDAAISENFSKTAEKYKVPPSNISQSIRRLERELGIELFSRQSNRIILNEKGREFYSRVSQALTLIADSVSAVSDDGVRGKINICINTNRRIVMSVVEKFQKLYPQVIIVTKFFCNPTDENFDLVISNADKRLDSFNSQRLLSEGVAIAMNSENYFANRDDFELSQLSSEPFISMTENSSLYEMTNSVCTDFGFKPNIVVQSDDPFYVRKCVELGLGVALVPDFTWSGQFPESVVLKNIQGYSRTTYLYNDKKRYMPLCVKRFMDLLILECRNQAAVTKGCNL